MSRRRFGLVLGASLFTAFAITAIAACTQAAPVTNSLNTRDDDDSGSKNTSTSSSSTSSSSSSSGDVKPPSDPPLPDGGKPPGAVFAHTQDTLYLFEPLSKKLTKIAAFDCLDPGDRVLDIALDRNGIMYGTSDNGFLKIDTIDAKCSYKNNDPTIHYPNSLGFVPLGTVDPTKEALVGYQDVDGIDQPKTYVRIDLDTGAVTKIGDLNDPAAATQYKSSGDLISLIRNGNKAYLTVKNIDPEAGTGNDFLAEIDPSTGQIKTIIGDTQRHDLFGLGQWAGTAYAFSGTGDLVQIDMTNATSSLLFTLTDDVGNAVPWFGAGVTTDSPTAP